MPPGEIAVSYFATVNSTKPEGARHTWSELVEILSTHKRLPRKEVGRLFSPVEYEEGHTRADGDHPAVVTLAVSDLDHAVNVTALQQYLERHGLAYVIYSSYNHKPDAPRVRVVVPMAAPVTRDQWPDVVKRWLTFLAESGCKPDTGCIDAKRMYYLPAAPKAADVIALHGDGDALTLGMLPALVVAPPPPEWRGGNGTADSDRPGDDFNQRGEILPILEQHGWFIHPEVRDPEVRLTRPGKNPGEGISATFGHKGRRIFYVFTSSAPPFEPFTGYAPFTVYALLEHGGNFVAAASELRRQGFGSGDSDQRINQLDKGTTPDPGAGQPEEDDSMEALTQARETIAAAIEARTASAVLDNPEVLKALAALPPGERTDSQQAIKKAIPQIGLRQLRAAIPSAKNAGNGAGRPHGDDSTEAQTQVNDTKVDSEARDNIRLRHFPLSDAGNAEMFATIYGHNVRYMHGLDRWLVWRGHWWQPDTNGELFRLAKGCARVRFQLTWDQIQDEKGRKASAAHAIRSEQGSGIAAMLKLARAEHPITVGSDEADQWDSDPWLIAVANGVVDLRTGDLRAGKREDRVTMNLPFRYDPEAACPRWAQFIAEVMDGDPEMVAYLQRQVGYSLTGLTSEQVWWLLYGKGANGKSVFLETLADAFAPLAFTTPFATFERQRSGGIPNDLAALAGRRLVMASETNENAKLNEARIKGVVHGGPQTARFLNKEFFTFNSQVKLWLGVNHKPQVDDNSKGFWRSVHMVPFTRTFEGAAADPHLKDKLMIEAPGILAWAVRGCLEWQRVGLNPPAIVTAATAEYRREADQMSEFIADACETGPGCQVQAGELAKAYGRWAEAQGMHERDKDRLTATTLGRRMADREGVSKKHGKRGTIYHGIGLKSDGLEGSDVD